MELDPETGETRPIIEPENKSEENLPTLNKKDRKYKHKNLKNFIWILFDSEEFRFLDISIENTKRRFLWIGWFQTFLTKKLNWYCKTRNKIFFVKQIFGGLTRNLGAEFYFFWIQLENRNFLGKKFETNHTGNLEINTFSTILIYPRKGWR